MKKIRIFNSLGLINNLIIIALCVLSYFSIAKGTEISYARLDVLASFIIALAAVLMLSANIVSIVKGETRIPKLFTGIYFIATVTGLVGLAINLYSGSPSISEIFSTENGYLYYGFLIPLFALIDFLFFAIDKKLKFRNVFIPFIAILVYLVVVETVVLATGDSTKAPYAFFRLTEKVIIAGDDITKNIIVFISVFVLSFVLSFVIWLVNRICHRIIFGSSIEELEEEENPKAVEEKKEKETVSNVIKNSIKFKNSDKPGICYHISYHNRKLKTWKVKGEEAGRALKVFDTQKEAIEYAKALVNKNGGSIRVHSMVGKIRKE